MIIFEQNKFWNTGRTPLRAGNFFSWSNCFSNIKYWQFIRISCKNLYGQNIIPNCFRFIFVNILWFVWFYTEWLLRSDTYHRSHHRSHLWSIKSMMVNSDHHEILWSFYCRKALLNRFAWLNENGSFKKRHCQKWRQNDLKFVNRFKTGFKTGFRY